MSDQTEETIFNKEQTSSTGVEAPAAAAETTNTFDSTLSTIVDPEGRQKYASVEAALSSIAPAQEHIARLEAETAELRSQLDKSKSIEDVLTKLDGPSQETPADNSLSAEAIAALVQDAVVNIDTQKIVKNNQDMVVQRLYKEFGEEAQAKYLEAGKSLGLDASTLDNLAGRSPQAIFKMLSIGEETSTTTTQKAKGSVNTETFQTAPPKTEKKVVMYGSNSADLRDEWAACKPT